jgi:hypothetical protein
MKAAKEKQSYIQTRSKTKEIIVINSESENIASE